jgi:hypothetical protein
MNDISASHEEKRLPLTPEGMPDAAGQMERLCTRAGKAVGPIHVRLRCVWEFPCRHQQREGYLTWRGAERDTQAGMLIGCPKLSKSTRSMVGGSPPGSARNGRCIRRHGTVADGLRCPVRQMLTIMPPALRVGAERKTEPIKPVISSD